MQCRWAGALLTCAVWAGTVCGCGGGDGPPLGRVSGTIKLDGNPLPGVNVTFIPDTEKGGSTSYGITNDSGVYTLMHAKDRPGAVIGKHRVQIEASIPDIDDSNPTGKAPEPTVKIPPKYRKAGTLTAEVKAGSNTINFDLDSK